MSDHKLTFKVWTEETDMVPKDEALEVHLERCAWDFKDGAKDAAEKALEHLNDEGDWTDRGLDLVVEDPAGDVWDIHATASLEIRYSTNWDPKKRCKEMDGLSICDHQRSS